jgi:hypothetical protein
LTRSASAGRGTYPSGVLRRLVSAIVVPAVIVSIAATSAQRAGAAARLDPKRLAKQVSASVAAAYPDLPVTKAVCPGRIPRTRGATGLCTVTAGGLSLQMRVTATDARGSVAIESTQAVIPKAHAEAFVRDNATLPAIVDCGPDPYLVRPPGVPFSCTVRFADGTVNQVTLSPADETGTVTITQVL